jgi:hypothetical protein
MAFYQRKKTIRPDSPKDHYGSPHTIKRNEGSEAVMAFWFHSAV